MITATSVSGTGVRLGVGAVRVDVERDFDGETQLRRQSGRQQFGSRSLRTNFGLMMRAMTTNPGPTTTPAVANCDGSVDFASDRYDASSATSYDANLDANTYRDRA